VVVNCPALPDSLLESELFGVEKGEATGVEPRPGRFETAHGGTLLLDEIGDMGLNAQAEILRVLEERMVERIGGREPIRLDVRILASTNHDLKQDMEQGTFRRDLYHRLNTLTLVVPPLRERRDDVGQLAEHFLAHGQRPDMRLSHEALELLVSYDFPGNVRELERMMERAELLAVGDTIEARDLPEEVTGGGEAERTGPLQVPDLLYRRIVQDGESFWELVRLPYLGRELSHEAVRRLIERAYTEAGGSYKRASKLLGVENEYKKLMGFLGYHGLRVKR
jgi:transcriptional regulator with GAF, ATPase, and Fis domain